MESVTADVQTRLQQNLATVEQRIAAACHRANRPRDSVTLVGVTKRVSADVAGVLVALGVRDLGENRPQELWRKHAALDDQARFHLIGQLQTNKVRRSLPLITLLHSLDRGALAEFVSGEAVRARRTVPVTLEVQLSGEEQKAGFRRDELLEAYPRIIELPGLEVRGLMCMARHEGDPELCRPTFRDLRSLRDELEASHPHGPRLPVLSMGMSNDFEVAIEEGATHVRIGSALFEGLEA